MVSYRVSIRVRDGFGVFGFFSQYYPELFPPCNITVMRKQQGTLKLTYPPVPSLNLAAINEKT